MNYFRMKDDGRIVTEQEYRMMHPNTSLPIQLQPHDADPILNSPKPDVSDNQVCYMDGVTQDALGNWIHAWAVRDKTTDEIAAERAAMIPEYVEMVQARLALHKAGILAAVQYAIQNMAGEVGEQVRIEWEFRPRVRRDAVLVEQMRQLLDMTEEQMDDLFILAKTL